MTLPDRHRGAELQPAPPAQLDPRPAYGRVILPGDQLDPFDDLAPRRRRHGVDVSTRYGAGVSLGWEPPPAVHEYAPRRLKATLGGVALVARTAAIVAVCLVIVAGCVFLLGVIL